MTEAFKKRKLLLASLGLIFISLCYSEGKRSTKKRNEIISRFYPARYQKRSSFCLDFHSNQVLDGSTILRFHKETQRCYRIGERGPCGEMMVFTIEDTTFGVCDCDQSLRCGRPLVFWPSKNRCYYVQDQGPCREGKVLVFGFDLHPVCRRNPCLKQEDRQPSHDNRYWFSYKGQCYRTHTQGYCEKDEILFNKRTHFRPTCVKTPECALGKTPRSIMPTLACLPGQRLDFYGKCVREYQILKTPHNLTDLKIPVTQRPTNLYCLFCKHS